MRRQLPRVVVALLAAAALLFGLLRLGQFTRARLDAAGHYTLRLHDFRCDAPPGLARDTFLDEVQYLGGLPDSFDSLDKTIAIRLAAAFARHPWVERIDAVTLRPPTARLTFRAPVLAVADRAVDASGVLLPAGAPLDGLPVLSGVAPPQVPAGTPWGNADIEDAARAAAALKSFADCLRVTAVEATPDGPVFTGSVRIRWGRGDTTAKVAKLREACAKAGGLGAEIDLR
ncbi:MAG: hypothetical protein U0746_23030 [Gemmataceae bacterium]